VVVAARLWEATWARLDEQFSGLASRVCQSVPQQKWSTGHYANASFYSVVVPPESGGAKSPA